MFNFLKDVIIPYEMLQEIKIDVNGTTIPLEDFLELKIKQVIQESKEG